MTIQEDLGQIMLSDCYPLNIIFAIYFRHAVVEVEPLGRMKPYGCGMNVRNYLGNYSQRRASLEIFSSDYLI